MRKSRNKKPGLVDIEDVKLVHQLEQKVNKNKKDLKIKFQYFLKKINEKIKLKEHQIEYSNKIKNNRITCVTGAAGTSKTFTACYTLLKLLFEQKIDKIIFTKPVKESGENLGFLPGTIEEKLAPYMESFIYTCKEILGDENINFLIENGYIENRPLAYMRGITFNRTGMFLDEAQNVDYKQLMLYITRIGIDSKIIIAGDVSQLDIKRNLSFLFKAIELFKPVDGVSVHEFSREDIVRDPILIQITDIYEKWIETQNNSN